MTDIVVRQITEAERRPCADVIGKSLLRPAYSDEVWERFAPSFPAERVFAAFDGDLPVGVANSFATRLAVPGGAAPPAAAVNGVGVRADHTRRGIATRLMAAQLTDCAARGEVFATLHASEATIYGHFGYGVGVTAKSLLVRRSQARLRADAPSGGGVRLLDGKDKLSVPREVYARIGLHRPGMIERAPEWWARSHDRRVGERDPYEVAVYRDESGVDTGFATYRLVDKATESDPDQEAEVEIGDFQVDGPAAMTGLWRYLTSIDLTEKIRVFCRPVDEPVESIFVDSRACGVTMLDDDLWVRIVDVPAGLTARGYGTGEPLVIEVHDAVLTGNSGRYRITSSGAHPTDEPAGLRMDVATLSMIYLGAWRPSTLAGIGRIDVVDADAPARADALFGTVEPPWCGTGF